METNVKAVELRELWRRYKQQGDERARERLVVAYSPMVKFIAGRMASGLPSHVEEADLISYGLLGLIGAIERFDLDREIKFETFAVARESELKDRLADAIESLPERERLVVALYYYENLPLREIGEVLGVTESRVSQLHTKAVLGLRSRFAGSLP